SAVARTLLLLLPDPTMRITVTKSFATVEGAAPVERSAPTDVGMPALAVVAIVVAVSAAAAYIAHEVSNVIQSTSFNNTKTQRLLNAQAGALDLVSKHADREKDLGKLVPYSDE